MCVCACACVRARVCLCYEMGGEGRSRFCLDQYELPLFFAYTCAPSLIVKTNAVYRSVVEYSFFFISFLILPITYAILLVYTVEKNRMKFNVLVEDFFYCAQTGLNSCFTSYIFINVMILKTEHMCQGLHKSASSVH